MYLKIGKHRKILKWGGFFASTVARSHERAYMQIYHDGTNETVLSLYAVYF